MNLTSIDEYTVEGTYQALSSIGGALTTIAVLCGIATLIAALALYGVCMNRLGARWILLAVVAVIALGGASGASFWQLQNRDDIHATATREVTYIVAEGSVGWSEALTNEDGDIVERG